MKYILFGSLKFHLENCIIVNIIKSWIYDELGISNIEKKSSTVHSVQHFPFFLSYWDVTFFLFIFSFLFIFHSQTQKKKCLLMLHKKDVNSMHTKTVMKCDYYIIITLTQYRRLIHHRSCIAEKWQKHPMLGIVTIAIAMLPQ